MDAGGRADLLAARAWCRRRVARALLTGSATTDPLVREGRWLGWGLVLGAVVLLVAVVLRVLWPGGG